MMIRVAKLGPICLLLLLTSMPKGADAGPDADVFDYADVKAGVEEVAFVDIRPNPVLRDLAKIKAEECKAYLAKFAPACWHILDPLSKDFQIKQSEEDKERFFQLAVVYAACVRSEILRKIVEDRRSSRNRESPK